MLTFGMTGERALPYIALFVGVAILYAYIFSGIRDASMATGVFTILAFFTIGPHILPFFFFFITLIVYIHFFIELPTRPAAFKYYTYFYKDVPDFMFIKDLEGRYRWVNRAELSFRGMTEGQMLGKNDMELFGGEEADIANRGDHEAIIHGRYSEIRELPLQGSLRRFLVFKYLIHNARGKPIGIMGIVRDMTEHLQLVDELQKTSNTLQMIMNSTSDPIFLKDTEFRYTLVNEAFANFFEPTPEEIIGKTDFDLISEQQAIIFKEIDQWVLEHKKSRVDEHSIEVDGRIAHTITTKSPLLDGRGNVVGLIAVSHDITKLRQIERQLAETQKMELLGNLAGGIAHDLNNVLSGVLGYGSLMRLLEIPEESMGFVENIIRSAEVAADLVKKLLVFTRRRKGQIESVDVNEVIKDTTNIIKTGSLKSVNLKLRLYPGELFVDGDRTFIEQLLMNLIVNSYDAVPDGGMVDVRTKLEFVKSFDEFDHRSERSRLGDYVVVYVRDNGGGISDEIREHIFEPYFTTKKKGAKRGSGIGLSIVLGVVNAHNGLIKLNSGDWGTEFQIYLPAGKFRARKTEDVGSVVEGEGTILVVDDDEDVRNLLRTSLESLGYQVDEAANGHEALALFSKKSFDLVILDYIMPVMDGKEVFRRLLKKDPGCRVVLVSGYAKEGRIQEMMQLGLKAVLHKPFSIETLSNMVAEVLN